MQLQQTFTPTFWRAGMELGLLNFFGTAFQVCVTHTHHAQLLLAVIRATVTVSSHALHSVNPSCMLRGDWRVRLVVT